MDELELDLSAGDVTANSAGEAALDTAAQTAAPDAVESGNEPAADLPAATEGEPSKEPAKKLTLLEAVEKNLKARAAEKTEIDELGEGEPSDEPEETAKTDEPDETDETEEKAKEKTPKKNLKPEDVDEAHKNDSQTARQRIKTQAQEIQRLELEVATGGALKETFETLGGQEGVDEILGKVAILEDPTRADEFVALVEAAPNFEEFKQKHFWAELDNLANQNMIIADQFGESWTLDKLKKTVDLIDRGVINLDEFEETDDASRLTEDELTKKKAERSEAEKLREENKQLREKEEKEQADEAAAALANRWNTFAQSYDSDLFPMLEDLGVLPASAESEEIQGAKLRHWEAVTAATLTEFQKNEDYKAIAKMVEKGQTETVTFKNRTRAFKPQYLDIVKRAVIQELPFLKGTLNALYSKQGTKPADKTQTKLPADPVKPEKTDAAQKLNQAPPEEKTTNYSDSKSRANAFKNAVSKSAQSTR